jgi:tetratricopeptide (TPR) repeat protein
MKFCQICLCLLFISTPLFSQTDPAVSGEAGVTGQTPVRPDAARNYRTGRDLEGRGSMNEAARYYNEAVRICMEEIRQNTATMDTYAVLTWTLRRQQKYAEVINWGERALRIRDNEYRIIETMGEAYFYLNDFPRSLSFMQRYVNGLPQGDRTAVAYFFIGEIFRLQGKFRHADIAYTTALRLDPSASLWWYRLGSVREAVGEYGPAIQAYEQALRRNPNYAEASQGLERSRRKNT